MSIQHSTQTQSDSDVQTDNHERFPREPSEYRPSVHFGQEFRDRNMRPEFIGMLLDGELTSAKYGKHKFVADIPDRAGRDHEWWLVVSYNPSGPNEIVTAYCPEFNDCEASYNRCYGNGAVR